MMYMEDDVIFPAMCKSIFKMKKDVNEMSKESKEMQARIKELTHSKQKTKEILQKLSDMILPYKGTSCPMQSLEVIMNIEDLHSHCSLCPIELSDKRIATGSLDGSISICSIDLTAKTWKQEIKKKNAHNNSIYSLCEFPNNQLVSSSEDTTIIIWQISQKALTQLHQITGHTKAVNKVININQNYFASCSADNTVKIWSHTDNYKEIVSLEHKSPVCSIISLSTKPVLVSSSAGMSDSVMFWDLRTYKLISSVREVCANKPTHMIELRNGCVALTSKNDFEMYNNFIIIIETITYTIVKRITRRGRILHYSSLCNWDDSSFVYIYEGNFLHISTTDYKILYERIIKLDDFGFYGIILINNEYLLLTNRSYGFNIIKPCLE